MGQQCLPTITEEIYPQKRNLQKLGPKLCIIINRTTWEEKKTNKL